MHQLSEEALQESEEVRIHLTVKKKESKIEQQSQQKFENRLLAQYQKRDYEHKKATKDRYYLQHMSICPCKVIGTVGDP